MIFMNASRETTAVVASEAVSAARLPVVVVVGRSETRVRCGWRWW